MTKPIDDMLVFMAVEKGGGHSVVATELPSGPMPMMITSPERLDAVKVLAKGASRKLGKPVGLFRFTCGETMWMVGPDGREERLSAAAQVIDKLLGEIPWATD
jgi:hypothetical protein